MNESCPSNEDRPARPEGWLDADADPELRHDLMVLARFITIYCTYKHRDTAKNAVNLKTHDVTEIAGRELKLCAACEKLLTHAFVKRSTCPMDPKPACKDCPAYCYHPSYREQIRVVMKYSGWRLLVSGRLDYLYHLLF